MTQSNAQRQAAWRKRRPDAGDNGQQRLNLWVETGAALALKRLAAPHNVTCRTMIEQLITVADDHVLKGIDRDSPEWERYFARQRRPLRSNARKPSSLRGNGHHDEVEDGGDVAA
jgi:hypothetical protein